MIGDAYASVSELEARLGRNDDGTFEGLLDAASRAVESFCRRQFNRDDGEEPTATARRFLAIDRERLPVDDFHTVTDLAVSVNDTAWDVDTVDPRPWDGVVDGVPGWPFFDLFAIHRSWPWSRRALVTVTAHWGWAAVPAAVKQATLNAATGSFHGTGGEWPKRQETIQDYSVSYAVPGADAVGGSRGVPREMQGVAMYRRVRFGVA